MATRFMHEPCRVVHVGVAGLASLSLCWPPLLASVAQTEAASRHSGRFTSHTLLAHFERCNQAHCVLVALLSLSARTEWISWMM